VSQDLPQRLDVEICKRLRLVGKVDVFLNGQLMSKVTMADAIEGVIERYVTDDAGRFVCDGDDLRREILRGNVRICLKAPSEAK